MSGMSTVCLFPSALETPLRSETAASWQNLSSAHCAGACEERWELYLRVGKKECLEPPILAQEGAQVCERVGLGLGGTSRGSWYV